MGGRSKTAAGLAVLFVAYQLPEGIGQRLLGSFAWQALLLGAFFGSAFLIAKWRGQPLGRVYALDGGRLGLAALFFASAVAAKVGAAAAGLRFGVYVEADPAAGSVPGALIGALGLTFVPSLAEDMLTRGYLFCASRRWRPAPFVAASAGFYVVNHVFRLRLGPMEWLMLLVFGVTYALAVARTGSLWPAVGLHWGWNYGNSAIGALAGLDIASPDGSRVIAMAAHGALAALVLLLAHQSRRGSASPAAFGSSR